MSADSGNVVYGESRITEYDVFLLKQGNHFRLYEKLGSHPETRDGVAGTFFAVWAPNAARVSVVGDFNGWNPKSHRLAVRWDGSGIWEGFVPSVGPGTLYKYHLVSHHDGYQVQKTDPFALHTEVPPRTASVVWDPQYTWRDDEWMQTRSARNALDRPFAVYEVHPGSWRRNPDQDLRSLSYRELAEELGDYVSDLGFTHVELMPVMEHPFFGSWGYQSVSYFAPTARYGTPQDLMALIDSLHRRNVGVILDWVPSHFPGDEHGLVFFDGTHLFEHADPRKGFHPDWDSYIFNYGRNEVRAFLISSAMFWLERYHADGLRVDAVASMLYLDYSRDDGQWIPNEYGGNENLPAISLIREFNKQVYAAFPDTATIAEESTAWPMVSRPAHVGGLGFGMKWNMGWMHDTLHYFSKDPIHRKHHHNQLTFSMIYAFNENFMLSLSHDEVVHGKGSLLNKMPGDLWQKFANLRLLLGYMYGHPGKKLLFMGGELAQWDEWNHDASLAWHLLDDPKHRGVQRWVKDLNAFYRHTEALHQVDFKPEGFEWIDCGDWEGSVLSFLRRNRKGDETVAVVCNFTPVVRHNYRIGVPHGGLWTESLNSDAEAYGGSGVGNMGAVEAAAEPCHGRPYSLSLTLPPLSVVFFRSP